VIDLRYLDTVEVWRSSRHGPTTFLKDLRAFAPFRHPFWSPTGVQIWTPPCLRPPGGHGGHDMHFLRFVSQIRRRRQIPFPYTRGTPSQPSVAPAVRRPSPPGWSWKP